MTDHPEMVGDFKPGDPILFIDGRDRQYMILAPEPGQKLKLRDEFIPAELILALHEGELFISPMIRRYLVFRPTLEETVMNMPRQAQVIYPKDLALMIMWADIRPGHKVLEVGCGHGAMTMALLQAIGAKGSLISCDLRQDHLNRTRKNTALYLGESFLERWTPVLGDPSKEKPCEGPLDRAVSDVPEPWDMVETMAGLLRPGGIWAAYVPSVMQMAKLIEAQNAEPLFSMPQGFENIQRFWHVRPPSVRPVHKMKAHTGFIITIKRRWRKNV